MCIPRFEDEDILEMKEEFKRQQIALKTFKLNYSAKNQDVMSYGDGVIGIPQLEEYYDNIEDNIIYTDLSWFSAFCKRFSKVNFSAEVNVMPDGSFQHGSIHVNLNAAIMGESPTRAFISKSMHPFFENLMPFKQFITNVEFSGNKHFLRNVSFDMVIDAKKINGILNEEVVNKQVLGQWMATLEHVITYNDRYRFIHKLKVINGRMSTITAEPTICFRFKKKR